MAIRVTYVHLADAPRLVRGRPGDLEPLLEAMLVDGIDIVYPDRHPHAFFGRIVAVRAKRGRESALAPAALGVLA
jgi:hypothetical protein